jgi:hypothetical protein
VKIAVKETYTLSVVSNMIRHRYQFESGRRIRGGSALILGIAPAILDIRLVTTRTPRVLLWWGTGIRILAAEIGLLNGKVYVSICCTLQVRLFVELVVEKEVVVLVKEVDKSCKKGRGLGKG